MTKPTPTGDHHVLPATCVPNSGQGASSESDTGADTADQLLNVAANRIETLAGGASGATYSVSSAVYAQKTLHFYNGHDYTRVNTMVEIADVT